MRVEADIDSDDDEAPVAVEVPDNSGTADASYVTDPAIPGGDAAELLLRA